MLNSSCSMQDTQVVRPVSSRVAMAPASQNSLGGGALSEAVASSASTLAERRRLRPARVGSPRSLHSSIARSKVLPAARRSKVLWCTLQVRPGHEHTVAERVRCVAPDILLDCFVLERQALRRAQGSWTLATEVMYPGYVFLVTTDPRALQERLKGLLSFGQLIEANGRLGELCASEIAFITAFGGPDHLVRFSRGAIVDGELVVHEGPLQGRVSQVRKIDRHKRIARLDIGGARTATVGLEVVSKT